MVEPQCRHVLWNGVCPKKTFSTKKYKKSNVMSKVYKFIYGNSSSIHPKKAGNKKIIRIGSYGKTSWDAHSSQAVSRLAIEIEVREEELSFWRTDG